ncbi:MAG: response regulator transcription factor [Bacilli bacterium]|nr:response regulator transcription factor [Bacilli bacterium]
MYNVAIVEDKLDERNALIAELERYSKETGTIFQISTFEDGFAFIDSYRPNYDIVFMDILMPGINGMDVSRQLRQIDPEVILIFTTSLAQYAVEGYEVNALDFIVKPVSKERINQVMERAMRRLSNKAEKEIVLKIQASAFVRVPIKNIVYIYADEHMLTYVTTSDRYEIWDSLNSAHQALPSKQFYRISRGRIINLAYVKALSKDNVIMKTGESFPLPRGGKPKFIQAMDGFFNI